MSIGMTKTLRLLSVASALALCGCGLVGPDYERPPPATPPTADFKETMGFRPALPRDAIDRGPWWTIYGDPALDQLMAQVDISNQTLKISEATYRQAAALIRQVRSGLYPTLGYSAGATQSGTGALRGGGRGDVSSGQFTTGFTLAWEIDVWGRIRRTIESDSAAAQASAGDLAAARLSAQSTLAISYFSLRISDARRRLLEESLAAYGRSVQIVQNQFDAGTASRIDLTQAQTLYHQTRSQLVAEGIPRAQFEHAIATLVGRAPGEMGVPPAPLPETVPTIDAGVPSALLERRPDIAANERQMAAANAQVGVAQAAYFPDFTLQASVGFASTFIYQLFQLGSQVWSVGPQAAGTLIDGGAHKAQVEGARANFDRTVATYRQSVLTAFQQIEDALAQQRILDEQEQVQRAAAGSARQAEALAFNQYRAGTIPYTTVIQTQTAALNAELSLLAVRQSRFTTSTNLVIALGGGWREQDLPAAVPVTGPTTGKALRKNWWWPF